jgi:diketogulonate reductase-like aldo/keto reductase
LQVELHPLLAQRKLVGVSYRKGVISVAYTPLGRRAPELLEHPVVTQIAAETGKTVEQVGVLSMQKH